MKITVLEHCRVSPPPGSVAGKSVPLTFFDIPWINFEAKFLFFYDFPKSKSNTTYFTQSVVPVLKDSLSLTLKHFFPLSGKLILPPSSTKPEIFYSDGDSVSLIFAECTSTNYDYFNHLSGNHARNDDELSFLVPQILPVRNSSKSTGSMPGILASQLLAVQVTLFPDHGISVGVSSDHVARDASTMFTFMRVWSSIAKLGGFDDTLVPFYDRSGIKDIEGIKFVQKKENQGVPRPPPKKTVRATFVLDRANIQGLKDFALTQRPTILAHASSFTVACAYVWTCVAKARRAVEDKMVQDSEELETFIFAMDCRSRLDPPLPATYYGNCLAPCLATRKTMELVGKEGFVIASESIVGAINRRLKNTKEEGGVLKGVEMWDAEVRAAVTGHRVFSVTGSPKFDYYKYLDFGWGMPPKKFEILNSQFSLTSRKGSSGGLEIGLCLPENEMDAFASTFVKGIN